MVVRHIELSFSDTEPRKRRIVVPEHLRENIHSLMHPLVYKFGKDCVRFSDADGLLVVEIPREWREDNAYSTDLPIFEAIIRYAGWEDHPVSIRVVEASERAGVIGTCTLTISSLTINDDGQLVLGPQKLAHTTGLCHQYERRARKR